VFLYSGSIGWRKRSADDIEQIMKRERIILPLLNKKAYRIELWLIERRLNLGWRFILLHLLLWRRYGIRERGWRNWGNIIKIVAVYVEGYKRVGTIVSNKSYRKEQSGQITCNSHTICSFLASMQSAHRQPIIVSLLSERNYAHSENVARQCSSICELLSNNCTSVLVLTD